MKAELSLPERPAAVHLLVVLDILVLLLVFFLLLTSISQEAGVAIRAPESSFRLRSYGKRIIVTARSGAQGRAEPIIYVGPKKVEFEDLEENLVKRAEESGAETMFLNADEMLSYGVAREIQELGLRLGLNVVLVGRQGGEDPQPMEEKAGSPAPADPGNNEKTEP